MLLLAPPRGIISESFVVKVPVARILLPFISAVVVTLPVKLGKPPVKLVKTPL